MTKTRTRMLTTDETQLLYEKHRGNQTSAFSADCARLAEGEPLAYIIGSVPFLNAYISVKARPFIPRPETEYWVEQTRTDLDRTKQLMILDIFTGSGCIGIALKQSLPRADMHFADSNPRALAQTRYNLRMNRLSGFVHASWGFYGITGRFNHIFANPPYIDRNRREFETSVLYEPEDALFADEHGFLWIRHTLLHAHAHLTQGGSLYLEFDSWQKDEIQNMCKSLPYTNITFRRDQYGNWRWLEALRA